MAGVQKQYSFAFTDTMGNPLNNGSFSLNLSADGSTGSAQVYAGTTLVTQLDNTGKCTVLLWAPASLTPSGLFYYASAYTYDGRLSWSGTFGLDFLVQEQTGSLFLLEGQPSFAILLEN